MLVFSLLYTHIYVLYLFTKALYMPPKCNIFVKSISRKFREIDFILEANPLFHFLFQLASLDNNIISGNWSNEKKEMFGDSFNFIMCFYWLIWQNFDKIDTKKLWWYFLTVLNCWLKLCEEKPLNIECWDIYKMS